MATAPAPKSKMAEMLASVPDAAVKKKAATSAMTAAKVEQKTDERFADIEGNTFFKIFFDNDVDPEQKKKLVVEALAYKVDEGKQKNIEALKEFLLFKEYMQNDLEELSKELIRLNDTDVMSVLQGTINDLNSGILDIEKAQQPIIEILDAMFELRKQGNEFFLGVFKEAKDDIAAEEQRQKDIAACEGRLQGINRTAGELRVEIEMLGRRRLGGLLGPTSEAQEQAIRKRLELEGLVGKFDANGVAVAQGELQAKATELSTLQTQTRETQYAEFAAQKAKMRELLDLTSEQHKKRSKDLVNKVSGFVDVTRERVTSVLTHMQGQSGQIDKMTTNTNGIRKVYAIIAEASKEVSDKNQVLRKELAVTPENESPIAQMTREGKLGGVDEYVAELGSTTVDTIKTFGNLQKQSVRLVSMKDANRQQIASTRELASSGISETAQSLATVLQGIASAGLNESSEAAKMSIETMRARNDIVIGKEAINTAMGLETVAKDLDAGLQQLQDYQILQRTVTQKNRENLARIQESMGLVQQKARELQDDVQNALTVKGDVDLAANVGTPANGNEQSAPAAAAPKAAKPAAKPPGFSKYSS